MTTMIADELGRIPMSPFLTATLTRAADYATAQSHGEVTLEHLLLALAEDPEASVVLKASNVDIARLAAEVGAALSAAGDRLPPNSTSIVLAQDLRRILEAAAAAAQQGRRREINGAIVLAAIVGDGRSTAAQMLRAQGLTFEEAIRALRQAQSLPDEAAIAEAPVAASSPAGPARPARERISARRAQGEAQAAKEADEAAAPAAKKSPPTPDLVGPAKASPQAPSLPQGHQTFDRPAPKPLEPRKWVPQLDTPPAEPAPAATAPMPPPGPFGSAASARAATPSPTHAPAPSREVYAPAPDLDAFDAPQMRPGLPRAEPAAADRRRAGSGPFMGSWPLIESGQLVENIPRRMRLGIPVLVEARIAKADVKALADGMQGGGAAYRHEVMVTKAMSVRLRAPDGGFVIETRSPETQWIENVLGISADDYASWRWTLTGRARGRRQLQLIVSARTVGADGLTAETALPDQVIEVKVGINYGRTFGRWLGWIVAAIAGGALARFGDGAFEIGREVVNRFLAG